MKTENIVKLNQVIGKALVEAAHEAYKERIERMKARPFDEVIQSIKNYKETGFNKGKGYFATEAMMFLDKKLEEEHEEIWLEIEDMMDDSWFKAVEKLLRW